MSNHTSRLHPGLEEKQLVVVAASESNLDMRCVEIPTPRLSGLCCFYGTQHVHKPDNKIKRQLV